ncbi:DEAD/DEAH box helicase [Mesorhizobium sp. CA4]|uniref:DEAD/DEAH box helicase n=1 Tax=Mesorhizobium sp. CA4 TaxID=588499 RepID=UPI001CD157AE|nr:DEAD/DEAH box helicase [Mesorhizobium sp. CA4]MBZ9820296.1 DEAD/DEAH box helicase [Mesorhizobium sp. CA4]
MDIFQACQEINHLNLAGRVSEARNKLILLLGELSQEEARYPDFLNHLIREAGLYPYLQLETASWQEKFVNEAFKVDVGRAAATLHREQSYVLSRLLEGADIAVSAPTSFGKSFIIDAFIAAKRPQNVFIIVPTIALMDETRRRIFKKFSDKYNIVTATEMTLAEFNIFIFPQERAFSYIDRVASIDLLIVDEFYKASASHDKERSPSLLKAILKLSKKAKQRYFLAPNVKTIEKNVFTKGMEFIEFLDFNTVYLEKYEWYKEIGDDEELKGQKLLEIIAPRKAKSLIYAGSYPQIDRVANLIMTSMEVLDRPVLNHFSKWLAENYGPNWQLTHLVRRGVGIHNGRMHRSLSQIQIKIFESPDGFDSIISTSSIIEGVNTSAENVIIWRNRLGNTRLNDFTYRNIIGRGGRMFKHFVGNIYLLESPPREESTQLEIQFPDAILGDLDEVEHRDDLDDRQVEHIIAYKVEMSEILGEDEFERITKGNLIQNSDSDFILELARNMKRNPADWNGFGYLNSDDPNHWDRMLYKVINLSPSGWDIQFSKLVAFIKVLSENWRHGIPRLLLRLDQVGIGLEQFFQLERNVTFKMSALLRDVNELHKIIVNPSVDVSPFIFKLSHAFLPGVVYQLEEYGLPRMISRKIDKEGLINLSGTSLELRSAIAQFQEIGVDGVNSLTSLTAFDRYIVKYFFEGITQDSIAA